MRKIIICQPVKDSQVCRLRKDLLRPKAYNRKGRVCPSTTHFVEKSYGQSISL